MIKIQSPTRVDLAGGTLDCWPLNLFVGDCVTVNLAIDIYTGCELTAHNDKSIHLEIRDLKYENTFKNISELLASSDKNVLLVQKIIEYFKPDYGFRLVTYSMSPVGGGLGGSSSLCISLIKAFNQKRGVTMTTLQMVELAHNLEAKVIHALTGTQDYIPAITAGLNIIHYKSDGISIEPLTVPVEVFSKNMLLIYTGKSHHSGINNWQVIKSVIEKDANTIGALKQIASIAEETANVCRRGDWGQLPQLFRSEFDSRIRLTASFSSPEIEKLKKIVIEAGGQAVKICGAGGGGCVLVWADVTLHERIIQLCQKNGFQPIKIRPVTGSDVH
jgi:D-glycero-alpha-D-manno-heptose-7-phosphate kinase